MSMTDVDVNGSELHERLTAIVRASPPLMRVLTVARRLCLPDWLVFSGAVHQPVLNQLIGRPLDYRIKDYEPRLFRRIGSLLRGRGCGNSRSECRFRWAPAKRGSSPELSACASVVRDEIRRAVSIAFLHG